MRVMLLIGLGCFAGTFIALATVTVVVIVDRF